MMRRLCWISLFVIVLALAAGGNAAAQAAPVTSAAQQGSSQICVLAFNDQDGNGARGQDEPLLAGVSFTLVDAAGEKRSYTSDGVNEYCFGSLAAGAYTVQARGASGLEVTTPGQWAISLAEKAQFDVAYGARQAGGSANSSEGSGAQSATTGSRMSDAGRIVLLVLGVIVLAGAALLAVTTFQRARGSR